MRGPVLSLVLPIFNEEAVIPELHARLQEFLPRLGLDTEVVFVDDGSKDRSLELLRAIAANEPRYRVVSFARNFGHQAAITAGIDHARGEAVVVMDADLQDPPEVVLEMVAKWREGFDVVYGRRRSRQGETRLKLLTAKWFYRIFARMIPIEVPLDTGDFRLMSRRIVVVLRELRETHRFVRGLVAWLGFRQTAVLYDRPVRFAGETKYPFAKMLRFAIDGITSFSILPLRFATYLGMLISALSVAVAIWALGARFVFHATVPGWTTLIVLVSLLASVQLIMTGILGEYIGRIYEQVKARPLYVLSELINFADESANDSPEAPKSPGSVSLLAVPRADLRAER
jgi:dolichol-phosphate mannosyltransferase